MCVAAGARPEGCGGFGRERPSSHGAPAGQQCHLGWRRGAPFALLACSPLQDQLGVFEGYSEDEDFNWSLVSSRPLPDPHGAQHPDSRSPQHEEHGSSPQEADQLPQVDGAGR